MSSTEETVPTGETISPEMLESRDSRLHVETVARERYVIGAEMARGGIGRILSATDKRLERQVALKELLDPSPEYEARFLREARVTAKLQHPAIVPVYDIGRLPNGEIFYAMKLVSGRSLGKVVEEAQSFDKRLALLPHVLAVAEAIAYAHSEHIVHRDLKPDNVLIGPFGETVVIDWGIAKNLQESETSAEVTQLAQRDDPPDSSSALTMQGAILGTPGYMPPEQAAGEPVTERADVYALGAILYHVLGGVAPYDGTSGLDVLTKVLTEPPLPLSSRERGVPRDLLAIVSKAMARDPQRRYPTANEFAGDLRLFQTGQIVGAYNYSRPERVWRFIQRHRAVVATSVIGFIVTAIIAVTSLSRVFDARRIAETERDRAQEERVFAQQKQSEAESAREKATQQTDALILIEARGAARRDPNAALAWLASVSANFNRWGEARLIAADAQEYGIATILDGHAAALNMAIYSPDGTKIATASDDRTIGVWQADGTLLRKLAGHTDEVWRVSFSTDSKRIISSSKDGTAIIWDVETGKTLHTIRAGGPETEWASFLGDEDHVALIDCGRKRTEIHHVSAGTYESLPGEIGCPASLYISPDAHDLAYPADGNLRIMDVATRKFRDYKNSTGKCLFVFMTRDGKYAACSGERGFASLWETNTGRVVESVPARQIPGYGAARFANDDRHVLMSKDSALRVIDLETGTSQTLNEHKGPIFTGFFSPDSQKLVTTSFDRTTVVFDLDKRTQQAHFGFRDTTCWADFSPNLRSLVVASWDHTARIFPLDKSRNRIIARGSSAMISALLSANDESVISMQKDGSIRIDPITDKPDTSRTFELEGTAHTMSADGNRVAFATADSTIHIHPVDLSAEHIRLSATDGRLERLHFSPNGQRLLSIDANHAVRLWNLSTRENRLLSTLEQSIISVAFSDDDALVALGDADGVVHVFPVETGPERTLEGHIGNVESLAFLPDNERLVSGGRDHTLRIWDLTTGNAQTVDASGLGIVQILVSSDGNTLYTLGGESSIRRWNARTGEPLGILRGHRSTVVHIELSPEGKRLISADGIGEIRLWDLATAQSRLLEGHEGPVTKLAFSPKGDKFISASFDGTVRIWYDDLPFDGPGLRAWIAKSMPTPMDVAPPTE